MTTFIAFTSPILGFSYFRRYANALLAASQFFSISHAVSDGDEIFLLDIGKTMDFSIQYVMMRTSYVMTRPSYVMMKTSLGEVLLRDFLSVLQVTQQHRQRVEISNATGRNVGMAQAVNLFLQESYTRSHTILL